MSKANLSGDTLAKRKEAAEALVQRGWYIFPVAGKTPFAGTKGFKDAVQSTNALFSKWDSGTDANPAIALAASNLTVLDIDHGFCDIRHALAWAESKGISNTMMVQTGRAASLGMHFYFTGTRANTIFKEESISGDVKSNGYTVAPSAMHESGKTYELLNSLPPAPLPDWLRDYSSEKKSRTRKAQTSPETVPVAVSPNALLNYGEEYPNQFVHHPKRHAFLLNHGLWLRDRGLEQDTIKLALRDLCYNRCNDGKNYYEENKEKLNSMAETICKSPIGRTLSKNGPRPRPILEQQIAFLIPEGVTCDKEQVLSQLRDEGFYYPKTSADRMALLRALKSLNISSYNANGHWFYERKCAQEAPESQS